MLQYSNTVAMTKKVGDSNNSLASFHSASRKELLG